MALDPNGCTFWETNEYYPVTGLDHHTRIGSFQFPGCTTVGNGTLSGVVSDGSNPIAGAIVTLGSRTATTDSNGNYAFAVPAGTYPSLTAAKAGFDPASASSIAVPNGGGSDEEFHPERSGTERLLHRQHTDRVPARRSVELRPDRKPGGRRPREAGQHGRQEHERQPDRLRVHQHELGRADVHADRDRTARSGRRRALLLRL